MPAWLRDAIWADRSRVHVSKRYGGNDLPSEMIALEPRVMLDGAVAVAAADQAEQAENAPAQEDAKAAEPAAQGQNTESDDSTENSGSDQDSGASGGEAGRTFVIVDASIQDPAELLAGVDPSAEIFYLNAGTDGVQQVTAILSGLSNVTSLQILSHGATGSITLGTTTLDAANIQSYTADFVTWDAAIADGGDILLYGCNVAEDRSGLQFIDLFADLTGADVAASIDVTGATELGGNWTLESEVGAIESGFVLAADAMDGYRHVLMAPANTAPTLTGLGASPNFTEGGVPVLIDSDVTVGDAEQNWAGGALTVSGLAAADNVAVRTVGNGAGQTSVSGADISVGGTIVATFAGGTSGTTLFVTFNAGATNADVEAVIENLIFSNGSDTPTASRALQFGLLDGAGAPAGAGYVVSEITGAGNPLDGVVVNTFTSPAFADIDNDGDLDAFVGGVRNISFFRNTGSAAAPNFVAITGAGNPFNGFTSAVPTPTFVDIDGDGDLDAFIGNDGGTVQFFRNDGNVTTPSFVAVTGPDDPTIVGADGNSFDGVSGGFRSSINFADIDNDGDFDAFIGESFATIRYFRNDGTTASPDFVEVTGTGNPFDTLPVLSNATPTFADVDNDGDLDVFAGEGGGSISFYRNEGNAASANFVDVTGTANPLDGVDVGLNAYPAFADIDNDGDFDVFVGQRGGTINFFRAGLDMAVTATVAAVNDAPTVTAPVAALAATEQVGMNIHGMGFSAAEVDEAGGQATATLTVGDGTIAVVAGTSGVTITGGNNTDAVTLTGTIAEINNLLTGGGSGTILYTNGNDVPSAMTTLTVIVNDQGNTGSDPGLTGDTNSEQSSASQTITIAAVNDAPVLVGVGNAPTLAEVGIPVLLSPAATASDVELDALNGGNGNYSGASFAFARVGGANVNDAFSLITGGNLIVAGGPNGGGTISAGGNVIATIANVGNDDQLQITFVNNGTIPTMALVSEVLRTVRFATIEAVPASVQVGVTLDDGNSGGQGTGGASSVSGTVTVNVVAAINDAPTVTAPAGALATTEQVGLNIHGAGFSAAEVDEAGGQARATLSVGEGSIAVTVGTSGVTITGGNNSGSVVLTGTIAQINNLLTGAGTGTIIYTNGSDTPSATTTFTVTVNDQGNTGTDPGLTGDANSEEGAASQTITITAVNDAPTVTAPAAALAATEQVGLNIHGTGFSAAEVDEAGAQATATLSVGEGTIAVTAGNSGVAITAGNNTGSVTLTGTIAQINTLLTGGGSGTIVYTNGSDTPSAMTAFTVTVNDQGNTGTDPGLTGDGNSEQSAASQMITITAINDAPTVVAPVAALAATEQVGINIHGAGFSAAEVDEAGGQATATLTVGDGTIAVVAGTSGVTITGGNNTDAVTLTGTIATINNLLTGGGSGTIVYSNNSDVPSAMTTFTVTVNDHGNSGTDPGFTGDANSEQSSASQTITIAAVNDAPVLVGVGNAPTLAEIGIPVLLSPAATASDVELDALNGGNGNYSGASFAFARIGGANANDAFSLITGGNLIVAGGPNGGGTISAGGNVIATIANVGNDDQLQITLVNNGTIPTTALVSEVLRAVRFATIEAVPASVQVGVTLDDGNSGGQGTGGALSVSGTVTVNVVAAINDAPIVMAPGVALATTEQVGLNIHGAGFSAAEVDEAGGQAIATLSVGEGAIAVTAGTSGVTITGGNNTGTVTLTGSIAEINNLLTGGGTGTIIYTNGSDTPSATTTFSVTVNDQGNIGTDPGLTGDANSEEGTASQTITIAPVNDAPTVTAPGAALAATEQVGLNIHGAGFSAAEVDEAGGQATATLSVGEGVIAVSVGTPGVSIASGNNTGAVTLTGTIAEINTLLTGGGSGTIVYTNGSDTPSAATTFTVTVNDQGNTGTDPGLSGDTSSEQASASQTINVTSVNDAPTLLGLNPSIGFTEGDVPVLIDSDVTVGDAEQNWNGGTLTVTGLAAADIVAVRSAGGQTSVSGTDISVGGTLVATFTGGMSGTDLTITFTAGATNVDVEAIIENLVISNSSDAPTPNRELKIALADAGGDLAAATLGLDAIGGADNPLNGVNTVNNSNPAFVDIDNDGDLDAFVGRGDGFIDFFRNDGNDTAPSFVAVTGADDPAIVGADGNPLNGFGIGSSAAPTFADIDNDGDLDAFVGAFDGTINFFRNIGSATSPAFIAANGIDNPFNGVDVGFHAVAAFADIDNDGDLDAFVGDFFGGVRFFRNNGDVAAPIFADITGSANPFNGVDVGTTASPAFSDIDNDGDLDAFIGERNGFVRFFRNTGDVAAPVFVNVTGTDNVFNGIDVGNSSAPTVVDIDNDGNLDAFIGESNGTIRFFRGVSSLSVGVSVTGVNDAPTLTGFDNSLTFIEGGAPVLIDGDVTVGDAEQNWDGGFVRITNRVPGDSVDVRSTGNGPGQTSVSGTDISVGGTVVATFAGGGSGNDVLITFNSSATNADVEAVIENLIYSNSSDTPAAERTIRLSLADGAGTFAIGPDYAVVGSPVQNFLAGFGFAAPKPAFVDIDNDGDLDLYVGGRTGFSDARVGTLHFFRNDGNAVSPIFSFRGQSGGFGNWAAPAFADIDNDGDFDLFTGGSDGRILFFRNDGDATTPNFVEIGGAGNPLNGVDVGRDSTPTFVDIDNDGDLDAFVGDSLGFISFFRNTGNAAMPSFAAVGGADNPFNGIDVGHEAAPAFADIDNDGDLDAMVGRLFEPPILFRNDGTAGMPNLTLVAGVANPFIDIRLFQLSVPTFADIDDDGDFDVYAAPSVGPFSFFQANPNFATTANVTGINDAPVLTGFGTAPLFTEGGSAVQLSSAGSVTDVELDILNGGNGDYSGATLVFARTSGANADDTFSLVSGGNLTIAGGPNGGGTISAGGDVIATITDVGDDDELRITFANNGTVPTRALVNEVMAAARYANSSDAPPVSAEVSVALDDGNSTGTQGAGGALSGGDTVTVPINAVNDAPVNSAPLTQTTDEDVAIVFSTANGNQLSISDDAGAAAVTTTLSATSGTVTVTTSGTAMIGANGTGTVTITGTVAEVNAALATVTFTSVSNASAPVTLTMTTNDGGNTGTGGPLVDTDAVAITINSLNDAPNLTGLGTSATFTEGGAAIELIPAGSVADAELDLLNGGDGDYSGASLTLARAGGADADDAFSLVFGGNLTIAGGPNGGGTVSAGGNVIATIANVGDNDELQITFSNNGTVPTTALVNEVMAAVRYANTSFAPPVSAQIAVNLDDGNSTGTQGAGGAQSGGGTVTVPIADVNNAPVNSVPAVAQSTNEDTDLVFSAGNGNLLSISDDAGTADVTTILSVTSGTLAVTTGTGTINDNMTGTVTITGTVAEVNAALAAVTFTPAANETATVTLTMTTNDGGNSGTGGPLIDTDMVAITINAFNDAPTVTAPGTTLSATEQTDLNIHGAGFSAVEVDEAGGQATATLAVGEGTITVTSGNSGVTVTSGNVSGSVTLTGTIAQINNLLTGAGTGTIVYTNTNNAPSTDTTFTVTVNDQGNTGTDPGLTGNTTSEEGVASQTIDIVRINDAPTVTAPAGALAATENIALAIHGAGFSATEVDEAGGQVFATLAVGEGTITVAPGASGVVVTGNDSGSVRLAGTIAQINSILTGAGAATIFYNTNEAPSASALFTVTVNDQGNTGMDPGLTGTDFSEQTSAGQAIDITAINDAPVVAAPAGALAATENIDLAIHGTGFSVAEVDEAGGQATATLTVGEGAITVATGDSGVTVTGGNTTGAVTLTGSIAQINNLLTGGGTGTIVYANSSNAPSASTILTIVVNDQGNSGIDPNLTGNGNSEQDTASQTITIAAVNDAPIVSAPGAALVATEQVGLNIHGVGFSVAEVDEGGSQATATLAVGEGTIAVAIGNSGVTITGGNNSGSVVLAGTIAQINNLLTGIGTGTIVYTNSSDSPSGTTNFTVTVNDRGSVGIDPNLTGDGTSEEGVASQTIDIIAINDAPTVAAPAGALATTENITLALQGTGFSVSEVDEAGGQATAILAVGEGAIAVIVGDSGVTVTGGNNTGLVTLTGTIAQINNLLTGAGTGEIAYNTTEAPSASTRFTVTVNDWGNTGIDPNLTGTATSEEGTASQTIAITAINDAPTVSAPVAALATNEQVGLNIHGTGFSVTEVDEAGSQATATLAVGEGTIAVTSGNSGVTITGGNNSGSVVLAGTIAEINNLLTGAGTGTIVYTNSSNTPSATTNFTVTVNDRGSAGIDPNLTGNATSEEGTASQTITVAAINDAPTVSAPGAAFAATEQIGLTIHGTGFTAAEVDEGGGQATATLTVGEGTIAVSVGNSGVTITGGNASGLVTLTGTIAQINTLLTGAGTGTIVYTNGNDAPSATTNFTVTVNDQGNSGTDPNLTGNGTSEEGTASQTITVAAVNDAPVNTIPVAQATNEDVALVFSAANGNPLAVADPDAGNGNVTTKLSVNSGTISATTTGTATINNNGSGAVTIIGTVAEVNAALATITYTPTLNFNGPDMLTVNTNDGGNFGAPGALADNDTVAITVNAVNDAPVNTVPGPQTTNEDTALTFSAATGNLLSVTDVDAGGANITTTLSVTDGSLSVTLTGPAIVTNNATGTVTIVGTVADVNAALASVVYTPALDFNGPTTLTLTTNDGGNTGTGGALVNTDTVAITVNPVNDAPVNTLPSAQATNEDTDLVFSAANGNVLSIADVDSGAADVTTTLSVTAGTLSATITGTAAVSNNATGTVTIVGTIAEVNAALATVTFSPPANFNGAVTFTQTTNDGGNTGLGGALTDTDTVAITVNSVNDSPVNSVPGPQTTDNDVDLIFSTANGNQLSIADTDAGGGLVTTILTATSGTLTAASSGGASLSGNGSAALAITGTVAQVNAALQIITFTPTVGSVGAAMVTMTTSDNGNTGSPGALSDTDTISVEVSSGLASTGTAGGSPSNAGAGGNGGQQSNFVENPGAPIGSQGDGPVENSFFGGSNLFGRGQAADPIITAGIGGPNPLSAGINVFSDSDLPGSVILDPSSDTGRSNSDGTTADSTPLLTGEAPANTIVTITSSLGGVLGTALVDGNGKWSFTAPVLGDGVHELIATPKDENGSEGKPSLPLLTTIDTSAPETPPAPIFDGDIDQLRDDAAPTFKGKAEPGAKIVLMSDKDGIIGEVIADENGNWQVTGDPLSQNTHAISVAATDQAGNVSAPSAALHVRVAGKDTALNFEMEGAGSVDVALANGSLPFQSTDLRELLRGFVGSAEKSDRFAGASVSGERDASLALGFTRQLKMAGQDRLIADLTVGV